MLPEPVVNVMENKVAFNHERLLGLFLLVSGGSNVMLGFSSLTGFIYGRWIVGAIMVGACFGFWMEKEWTLNAAWAGLGLYWGFWGLGLLAFYLPRMVPFWLEYPVYFNWIDFLELMAALLSMIAIVYLLVVLLVRRSRKHENSSP